MLTTHYAQVTNPNPNQSGIVTSVDLSDQLRHALEAAGVDVDQVHVESDDTIVIPTTDGRIAIGEEDGWITATRHYDEPGEAGEHMIYEGRSVIELAAAVAR